MIKNDSQLAITEMWITRFKEALANQSPCPPNIHPKIFEASKAGVRAKLKELEDEVEEYKKKKNTEE